MTRKISYLPYTGKTCSTSTINDFENTVWQIWNDECRIKIIHYANSVTNTWVNWNISHSVSNIIINNTVEVMRVYPETSRQREARERDEAQYRAHREVLRQASIRETAEAKDKAERLLQSALSEVQRVELRDKGFFHCKSKIGRLYRIYRGSHGNVRALDREGKKEVENLCVQPVDVPIGDSMLAQKLHIENDEEGFRRTANIRTLN